MNRIRRRTVDRMPWAPGCLITDAGNALPGYNDISGKVPVADALIRRAMRRGKK